MIAWLEPGDPFPPLAQALTEADGAAGLLAASATITPERLLDAYQRGIFPWFSDGQPVLWWSIDPRMVLQTSQLKISDSLRKRLRKFERERNLGHWTVSFDRAFRQVMEACAAPRDEEGGTWILPVMIDAYTFLHEQGYAHSVEVWHDGVLVGGAYGVCLGRMFYGESMFARERDASKIAFSYLVKFLLAHGVEMIDCQQETRHLASFGAAPIPRNDFIAHLELACRQPPITDWQIPAQVSF